jgi:uncharacterized membrane protein
MLVLIAAAIGMSVYLYPALPVYFASHWGLRGNVNGYIDKFWGVSIMPLIMIAITALWYAIPRVDPLKQNLKDFETTYNLFFLSLNVFFLYIFGLTLAWNLGTHINLGKFLSPGLAILFAFVGILLLNSKRNWFVGIRTPWTLSSDRVWRKTHKLGAVLFEISAAIMLLGVFLPSHLLPIIFVPLALSAVISIVYSYVEFRREKR